MKQTTDDLVLIPAGEFWMGSDTPGDHQPVHRVRLETFSIDRYQVTNRLYLRFCEETEHLLPFFWDIAGFRCGPDYPDHPVVGVSWQDAAAFAAWYGKRLPSEAEWEVAARGVLEGKSYPNGDTLEPGDGNYFKSEKGGPVAVGSYPPNGYGLYDMQGNVVEWVMDWYARDYYAHSPLVNPQGPETGRFRVIRGGGWHSGATCNRVYYRNALPPNWLDFNVGFRCAQSLSGS
jgi:formylglycine-generating enzyme required for sulfatase activity